MRLGAFIPPGKTINVVNMAAMPSEVGSTDSGPNICGKNDLVNKKSVLSLQNYYLSYLI